ncbi:MAG: heme-binding domain-containing protein [Pyrinomonadaceae bacterium]|nr:heme-binding domain-containing protein [Pyrinomonadaceae bacterium]
MQFIPATRNESRSMLETDFVKTFDVPFEVQKVLKTSCYDCHSNNTNYPWYNKIQPATWFLEGHITDGKKELNFSEFGSYSRRRQRNKLRSIVSQVKSDEMPLWSYTLIHWDADLSEEQKKLLEDWIRGIEKSL